MRTVTVNSTKLSQPYVIETDVTQWGQLKDLLARKFGDINNMKATLREGLLGLDNDESALPEGDFAMYLVPQRIKAGQKVSMTRIMKDLKAKMIDAFDEIIEDIDEGDYDVEDFDVPSGAVSQYTDEDRRIMEKLQQ